MSSNAKLVIMRMNSKRNTGEARTHKSAFVSQNCQTCLRLFVHQYHRRGRSLTQSESTNSDSHSELAHCHSEWQAVALSQHSESQTVTLGQQTLTDRTSQKVQSSCVALQGPAVQAGLCRHGTCGSVTVA